VSGFGRPPALMWAAVLIIAGGRPHYCDRPPVTEFYKAALLKIKRALLMNNEQLLSEKAPSLPSGVAKSFK
ncbi:MAG: hypothetical protein II078_04985, partial [Muribaculaceae bacterium]|nr:hypothetical protein [Muribaculaceae bacterium]